MKKFIFVVCLALTALPIFADGVVGQVSTECASMASDARREVVESETPSNDSAPVETTTTTRVR